MVFDRDSAGHYQNGMPNLTELREAAELTQKQLAKLAKTSQPQINRLETGERELTKPWAERLAPALKVSARDILFPPERQVVALVGFVGASGALEHFYANGQGPFEEVPAVEGSTKATVAVEVRGNSMGSDFDRALVYYDDVRRPVTGDLIGKLCVVGLPDGRVLVKKISRSKGSRTLFHLSGQFGDPILDTPIEWAAKVKSIVPR